MLETCAFVQRNTCLAPVPAVYEARLGREEYGGKYTVTQRVTRLPIWPPFLRVADHVLFNSFSQWERFRPMALAAQAEAPELHFGIRINPEHSEGDVALYDPCSPCSRMGVPIGQFREDLLEAFPACTFTPCQQDLPPLKRTLEMLKPNSDAICLRWVGQFWWRSSYQSGGLPSR